MISYEKPAEFSSSLVVAGCFVEVDGKCLLLKRSSHAQYFRDCWGLPGGKQDPGETIEDCIQREVFEETNVIIPLETTVAYPEIYCDHGELQFKYAMFRATLSQTPRVLLNPEHTAYCWMAPNLMRHMRLIPDLEQCARIVYDF